MSTEIKPVSDAGSPLWIYADQREYVLVQTRDGGASVDRADFLAAVAAECGVIIIDRAELPEVTESGRRDIVRLGESDERFTTGTAAAARGEALACLALAEYLDARPPLDEADVEALARLIAEDDGDSNWHGYVQGARRLLATGRIEVKR